MKTPVFALSGLLALLTCANAAASSAASVTSQLSWSELGVIVVDTNLSDGITPSFSFGPENASISLMGSNSSPGESFYVNPLGGGLSLPFADSGRISTAKASVALDSRSLSVSSATRTASAAVAGSSYAHSFAEVHGGFTLHGQGVAILTLPYSVSLVGAAGDSSDHSSVRISLSSSGGGDSFGGDYHEASFDSTATGNLSLSDALSFTWVNPSSATDISGSLSVSMLVISNSPISTVPEPRIYAMLLAGLGLIGVVSMRRKR